ncbi:N-acylsphingosine amidohydrolase [Exophiala viscosa]|uniref:N-acylsphingosine amidohydrolase n=1 Tax=Exophiala viscosa TaxID=2486360 RepID=UPI0021927ECC|nr:N-acylsphingosine amidohydrolase [Exophiala viscosa]
MNLQPAERPGRSPPRFTIDLSLNPEDRYKALAREYKTQIQGLTTLFDDLLQDVGLPTSYHGSINRIARLLLRRVKSPIETAELRGIAEVAGVPMYLLVSFNTILDLLMGCTSGAVKTLEQGQRGSEAKLLHFRTLDWTMDPLRSVVVQLDFVRTELADPSRVVARSITYVGFVGVLTGVRPNLSISLNFRAVHNANTKRGQFNFYFHHLLVLLGYRQSISSILRSYTLPADGQNAHAKDLAEISTELALRHTTAAYLVFCDGRSAIVMEKDYDSGPIRQSDNFIAATNNDEVAHESVSYAATPVATEVAAGTSHVAAGLKELLEESRERLNCITSRWKSCVRRAQQESKRRGASDSGQVEAHTTITPAETINWVSAYPTTNEQTHYATVLDPTTGEVVWTLVYPSPYEQET